MTDGKIVAQCIRENKESIIEDWERRVRSELAAAKKADHHMLTDGLPLFIDQMLYSLEQNLLHSSKAIEVSENHAIQRTKIPEYNIEQVLTEYRILLQVILDHLSEKDIAVSKNVRDIIFSLIHTGVAAAARKFSEKQIQREKEISQALQEAEEFRKRMLESSDDCFKVLDLDGHLIDITEKSLAHLEFENAQAVLGRPWISVWTRPEDIKAAEQALKDAKNGRTGKMLGYFRTKSGKREWWEVSISPMKDIFGNPEKLLAVSRDITEQYNIIRKLELSESQFRDMFEQIGIGKVITDPTTKKILNANQSFCKFIGYTLEELKQMTFKDITYPDDIAESLKKFEEFAKKRLSSWHLEKRYVCKNGDVVWASLFATALKDSAGNSFVLSSIIDISDRKKIEAEKEVLLKREKEARSIAEKNIAGLEFERHLRDQFVNTLTHDLRNPLAIAKMSSHLIRKKSEDERIIDLASKVINSLDRIDRMIKDLLDANRIRAGYPLLLELAECNVSLLTSDVVEECISVYGPRFKLETPKDLCAFISGKEYIRLLENLIGNAVKYGSEKEILIKLEKVNGEHFQVSVHNWGNPIPLENQKNLFEPFSRTSEAEAGGKKGWGLGLTLVRGVAEAHGGNVKVQSNEKEGTTFTVTFPIKTKNE